MAYDFYLIIVSCKALKHCSSVFKTAGRNPEVHEQQVKRQTIHPILGQQHRTTPVGVFFAVLRYCPECGIMHWDKKVNFPWFSG